MRESKHTPIWQPPTDLYEREGSVVVRVEVAGMRTADFDIALVDRRLTIHGVRPDVLEQRAYHQMEIGFGEFRIELELPCPVDMDAVEARYEQGFLLIVLPKTQPEQVLVTDQS